MINMELLERAHCTREEKKTVLSTIHLLVSLSEKARREGVLALEEEIADFDNPFMKLLFRMVVDGTNEEIIKSIGETTIIMSEMAGQVLLNSLIILEGSLCIQDGFNPYTVAQKLIAFLGKDDDLMESYIKEYENTRYAKDYELFFNAENPAETVFSSGTSFEDIAEKIKGNIMLSNEQQSALQSFIPSGNLLIDLNDEQMAIVLLYLDETSRIDLFATLSTEKQAAVIISICKFSDFEATHFLNIARISLQNIIASMETNYRPSGGVNAAATILRSNRYFDTLDIIEKKSPELFVQIKNKLNVFESLLLLDDISVRKILRETKYEDLRLSLYKAPQDIQDKIFNNLSKRQGELLKEDMQHVWTNIPQIKNARDNIVAIMSHLEDIGEIVIPRGNDIC